MREPGAACSWYQCASLQYGALHILCLFPACDAPETCPNSLVTLWCRSARIFLPPSPWAWIDPGVFALFGAGAFMGGTTRLTIALAVIMMEVGGQTVPQAACPPAAPPGDMRLVFDCLSRLSCATQPCSAGLAPCRQPEQQSMFADLLLQMSNDVRMLLPVLVAIMVAKWVADAATHSLYHGQLHVKVCCPACFTCTETLGAGFVLLLPFEGTKLPKTPNPRL